MANTTNTVEFVCKCGQKIRARIDQGGKVFKCTSCAAAVQVPSVSVAVQKRIDISSRLKEPEMPVPATFRQLLIYLASCWLSLLIISLIIFPFSRIVTVLIFVAAGYLFGYQMWIMLLAKQRVLSAKNIPLLWSSVRMIAWDPVEGVLILRNKAVAFCDDDLADEAGGVRLVYSILGEELALRAPLEVQTLSFRDENVLTREYLSVTIRGTMKWRIVDLKKFYLLVSRELRSTTNHSDQESISTSTRSNLTGDGNAEASIRQLLRAAISWMQVLVEEETRSVVSRARSGLLIADKLGQELFPQTLDRSHSIPGGSHVEAGWGGAADGLAGAIHDTIARRLEPYGIGVEDVSLQEIKLPDQVMQECIEACKAFYLPTIAQRKASSIRENLLAQADVIGKEALATKEVISAAPAFTLPDFLSQYLQKRTFASGNSVSSDATALLTAATVAQNAGALPQTPAVEQHN